MTSQPDPQHTSKPQTGVQHTSEADTGLRDADSVTGSKSGAYSDVADLSTFIDSWPEGSHLGVSSASAVIGSAGDLNAQKPLASVTKIFSAYAILVALEEGSVSLDDPVGPPGSTLRNILSHSSGLGMWPDSPVGVLEKRRVYSNTGIDLAAGHLEEKTQIDFGVYLQEAVLDPLGLADSELQGSASIGMVSSVSDLLKFGRELLDPSLIHSSTLAEATSAVLPDLRGVLPGFGYQRRCLWGLGFELRGDKSPHWMPESASAESFGHFGVFGAFLWVDPKCGIAVASVNSTDFDHWAKTAWPDAGEKIINWVRDPDEHASPEASGTSAASAASSGSEASGASADSASEST